MSDEIEEFFVNAAMVQAIIHAGRQPPEKTVKTFEELMAWLDEESSTDQTSGMSK